MDKAIQYHFNKDIKEKIQLDNGWKESWLLTLSDNQKVVFRAYSDYEDRFEREKFFYDTVNKKIGRICPEVYVVDGTCEYYHKSYQISEYIEGKVLRYYLQEEFNDQQKKEIYHKVGETIARINKIEIDLNHTYVVNGYSWQSYYMNELLQTQLNRIVKNELINTEEIEKICDNMREKKIAHSLSFLHRDIRPDNLIYNNGKLFVIDAETCEFGDPLNELARINLEWHFWEMYDCLLNGYKSVMNIDTDSELFFYYQLEWLGELLDMHYNHGCMNSTTPYFLKKFNEIKDRLTSIYHY